MQKGVFLGGVILILVVSLNSLNVLPWYQFPGVDFENIYAFQHCAHRAQPYGVPGAACGDSLARDLYYPPLLYNAFVWTRLFASPSHRGAYIVWATLIVGVVIAAFAYWHRQRSAWSLFLFALVLFQMPTVFAVERGNTDAGPLALWIGATYFFQKKKWLVSGLLVGLAASFKLYPGFAALVIVAGSFSTPLMWVGMALGVLLPFLLFFEQSKIYFLEVMPKFAKTMNPATAANHAILPRFPDHPWLAKTYLGILLFSWGYRSFRGLKKDPMLVFAGALAISTYFSGVSEDYNLISTFPLLFLQLARREWLGLFGVLAVFGERQLLTDKVVALQLLWLVATAWSDFFPARYQRLETRLA